PLTPTSRTAPASWAFTAVHKPSRSPTGRVSSGSHSTPSFRAPDSGQLERFLATLGAELVPDRVGVGADGDRAQNEPLCNLGRSEPDAQEFEHLPLARGELWAPRDAPPGTRGISYCLQDTGDLCPGEDGFAGGDAEDR